jgi:hypothetical protein
MNSKKSVAPGLLRKVRDGRYGDVRLLALCVGILVFCALSLLFAGNAQEDGTGSPSPVSSPVDDSDSFAQESDPATFDQSAGDENGQSNAAAFMTPSSREREDKLRDMTRQMPEGETIIY